MEDVIQAFITKRLNQIYLELDKFSVKNIYNQGKFPDYTKYDIQKMYNLKYLYAYLLEYYEIFKEFINMNFISKPYKVLSLGTGSGFEYYGFVFALLSELEVRKLKRHDLFFTGIDKVDWLYRSSLGNNNCCFIKGDVSNFKNINSEEVNVIIFPKSICEFNNKVLQKLVTNLSNESFKQKKICIINSLVNIERDRELILSILKVFEIIHGYRVLDSRDEYSCYWVEDLAWSKIYNIKYPEYIYNELKEYNISPMLKSKYMHYQIFRLEKI